jgi:hypothetical protein
MNLATLALTLYLRNPVHRSVYDDLPLIVLPNGRRIVIQEILHVDDDADGNVRSVWYYRLLREYDSRGTNRVCFETCYDLESVAKQLSEQSTNANTVGRIS